MLTCLLSAHLQRDFKTHAAECPAHNKHVRFPALPADPESLPLTLHVRL